MLLHDVGEEWALVVDAERENPMLVGEGESSAVYSAIFRATRWKKRETVERRKHCELELHGVPVWELKRYEPIMCILRELNAECL